jgi:hypothetical protein
MVPGSFGCDPKWKKAARPQKLAAPPLQTGCRLCRQFGRPIWAVEAIIAKRNAELARKTAGKDARHGR